MSWDVILTRVSPDVASARDVEKGSILELGPKAEVLLALRQAFADIDLSDPSWGILRGDGFSIEFNMGQDDPVRQIMLHVRGGDSAIDAIRRICEFTGWRALDMTTGDFIDFSQNPAAGLQQWRRYRDQVVAHLESEARKKNKDEHSHSERPPS